MRIKQQRDVPIPEVDLIPMLNVMMGILAFFVMITMTLGNQAFLDLQLPAQEEKQTPDVAPDPKNWFLVELDVKGQAKWNNKILSPEELSREVKSYLSNNAKGVVLLLPNPKLPYKQVIQKFSELRKVGGDRVSLVID